MSGGNADENSAKVGKATAAADATAAAAAAAGSICTRENGRRKAEFWDFLETALRY